MFEKEADFQDDDAGLKDENAPESVGDNEPSTATPQETESIEARTPEKSAETAEHGSTSPQKPSSGVIELSCQVCNCSFTNYHEHMNSEAHKAKINHSNSKIDAEANAEAGKVSPKSSPASQTLKRCGDQDSAPSPKRIKSQTNNPTVEKFRCDICSLTILRKQDYDHHMSGKKHLINASKAQGKSYCEICKLFFNSLTDLNDHTESQLHKKNIADKKQEKRSFDCDICNVSSLGEKQYEQHLSSKRHKRSLERPAAGAGSSADTVKAKPVNGSIEPKVNVSQKKWLYVCNACNFVCNFDQQFSAHMILAEHKAAVTDMKRKGLMHDKDATKPTANNSQTARKFISSNVAGGPRTTAAGGAGIKPVATKVTAKPSTSGPVASNVAGLKTNAAAPAKQGQMKNNALQANRKAPVGGPKKNLPMNKANAPLNKPPLNAVGNRPNPRFVGKQGEHPPNKFMSNPPPLKLGFQKMPFDAVGKFGPSYGGNSQEQNAGGNFGSFRPGGNYGGDMRNDNINHISNVREDFRGDARADFRGSAQNDYREIRDIRSIDLGGDSRGETAYRSSFYREIPSDSGRDARDYRGTFRADVPIDVRSDMRSVGGDMRSMVRSDMRSEAGADTRGYGNTDMRGDLRNDSRGDYTRDRNTLSNYGASAGYGQSYRGGGDDYRSDSYGRGVQSSGSGTPAGNYSAAGAMTSGRYESFMDRPSAAFSSQYAGASRGYMGDLPLNGR